MGKTSPTQRSLQFLRKAGRNAAVVEKWNPYAGPINPKTGNRSGIRQDLFGFIDIVVVADQIIGIQACAGSGHAARRNKILTECAEQAVAWLLAGGLIEVWSWSNLKVKPGGKARRWNLRVESVTLDDFPTDLIKRTERLGV